MSGNIFSEMARRGWVETCPSSGKSHWYKRGTFSLAVATYDWFGEGCSIKRIVKSRYGMVGVVRDGNELK